MTKSTHYIPALGANWLTPVYDFFTEKIMPEQKFKSDLIARAGITPGQRVLDLGAGTGTLAILVKQTYPTVEMVGLDGDPAVLAIAREKAAAAGLAIAFDQGDAGHLVYPDGSFDRVLSSLVMHHLDRETKQNASHEAFRVLKTGGELWVADFGQPHGKWARLIAPFMRTFERAAENIDGLLPTFFQDAGFADVSELTHFETIFGTLTTIRARKRA